MKHGNSFPGSYGSLVRRKTKTICIDWMKGNFAEMRPYLVMADCFFKIFEAMKANNPNTTPEIIPTIGPVTSIISRGESGKGIFCIIAASFG